MDAAQRLADLLAGEPSRPTSRHYGVVTRTQGTRACVRLVGSAEATWCDATNVKCVTSDWVEVEVRARGAVVTANRTHPVTDDTKAGEALDLARVADAAATQAQQSADAAGLSASAAQASADSATAAAASAWGHAESALTAAGAAWDYAADASSAAAAADEKADAAAASAAAAQSSATRASTAASDALTQLSVVEDVAGTLAWVSEHGTFTLSTDTEPVDGTVYFELDDGDYIPVAEPSGSPLAHGWYVLDITDSQSDYIMAHLAVTAAGLWVLPSGMGQAQTAQYAPGYKLLLASTGAYLYDASGHLVTTYGESITFDSSRPQYIGGEDAYIVFYDSDGDGVPDSIRIGGSKVTIGGSSLSQVLADVAQASASAQQALDMCTIALTSTAGTVFKQDRGVSTTIMATVFTGDGLRITDAQALRGRFGAGAYLQWRWRDSGTDGFVTLLSADPRITAGGFALTVTPDDISTQAVIDCELVY